MAVELRVFCIGWKTCRNCTSYILTISINLPIATTGMVASLLCCTLIEVTCETAINGHTGIWDGPCVWSLLLRLCMLSLPIAYPTRPPTPFLSTQRKSPPIALILHDKRTALRVHNKSHPISAPSADAFDPFFHLEWPGLAWRGVV